MRKRTVPPKAFTSETAPRQGRIKGSLNKFSKTLKRSMAAILNETLNSGLLQQWIMEVEDPAKRFELTMRLADKFIPNAGKQEGPSGNQEPNLSFNIIQVMNKYELAPAVETNDEPAKVREVQGVVEGCVLTEGDRAKSLHKGDAQA